MKLTSTQHGSLRLDERCNIKSYQTDAYLEQVKKLGISYNETYGELKAYLNRIRDGFVMSKFIIYNRRIFIFSKDYKLITVFNLRKKYFSIVRTLERGVKKDNKKFSDIIPDGVFETVHINNKEEFIKFFISLSEDSLGKKKRIVKTYKFQKSFIFSFAKLVRNSNYRWTWYLYHNTSLTKKLGVVHPCSGTNCNETWILLKPCIENMINYIEKN